MRLKTVLKWLAAGFAASALVLALLGYALGPDTDGLRQRLEQELSAQTGRPARIATLDWSLFPTPGLQLSSLSIRTGEGLAEVGLEIASLHGDVDWGALFDGQMKTRQLRASGVVVTLSELLPVPADGRETLRLSPTAAQHLETALQKVELEGVTVRRITAAGVAQIDFDTVSIARHAPGTHAVRALGHAGEARLELDGQLERLSAYLQGIAPVGANFSVVLGELSANLSGDWSVDGVNASLELSGQVPPQLTSAVSAIDLKSDVSGAWPAYAVRLQHINLSSGGGSLKGDADLRLSWANGRAGLAGDVNLARVVLRPGARALVVPSTLFDADVTLRVAEVVNAPIEIDELGLELRLDTAGIYATGITARVAGGAVEGELSVQTDAADAAQRWRVVLRGRALDTQALFESKASALVRAPLDVDVDLKARGAARDTWIASTSGTVTAALGKGEIRTGIAETLVGGLPVLFESVFAADTEWATLNCGIAALKLRDGVATTEAMVVDTANTTVVTDGYIDLPARELALLVSPHPKQATLNLAVPLRVTGSWDAPSVSPEESATARRVGGVLAGFVFPPALLAAFADLGYDGVGCMPGRAAGAASAGTQALDSASRAAGQAASEATRALDAAGKTAAQAASEAERVLRDAGESAGKTLRDAGEATGAVIEDAVKQAGQGLKKLFDN